MQTNIEQSQEISIKTLILKFKLFSNEILRNWIYVVSFTALFAAYMIYRAIKTPTTYRATLTFMVNEDETGFGAGSSASGILGSLGFMGSSEYNLDKILQLSKSFKIISEALFLRGKVRGVDDYYINHLIRSQFIEGTPDYSFNFTHSDIAKFNIQELRMLKRIFYMVSGAEDNTSLGLLVSSYEKLSGIMKMTLTTKEEEVSIALLKVIYGRLGDFYVEKSIEKQRFTYELIMNKADSLKSLLLGKESSRARFDDRNRGLISESSKVPAQRMTRDLGMLTIMYTEAIKNAEVADFAIKSKVPFVQSIDIPLSPLKALKPSLVGNTVIGVIIGLILSSIFFIMRKIFMDSINESE